MCGIVGLLNVGDAPPVEEASLRRMLAPIRHRGPDQLGICLDGRAGLGSARLSIVDLEGGRQPIPNEDASLWIVFNGEIFNHRELRAGLEERGHRFRSRTDTEVVLHLYEDLGPACLERLNGQFALAIRDRKAESLFLARDRLGIRPLFYAHAGSVFGFGSEIKALLAEGRFESRIDPVALDDVFTFWSTLPGRSAFEGVAELPPGHTLTVSRRGAALASWWRPTFPGDRVRAEDDLAGELRALLVDATRVRLRADVPVGAYLSGGLDSSAIASIARGLIPDTLETFSIAFRDSGFDEREHQTRMARALGTRHHVLEATHADIGGAFPDVVWHTETPVLRTAPVPMFLLSKLVHDHGFKVVLTGEGADEILAGYDIFKETMIRRFWARHPSSRWRPLLLRRLYPDIPGLGRVSDAYLRAFFGAGLADTDAPDYSHAIRWKNTARTKRFFSEALRAELAPRPPATSRLVFPPDFAAWDPLQKAQFLEASLFLPQYLLSSQGDRVAMAHAVEGRHPFLDVRVVEFCGGLPSRLKMRVLREKALLRTAAKGWVPEEIRTRPKRPYRAPIARSFFGGARLDYVRDLLSPGAISSAGFFDARAVTRLVEKARSGLPLGETDEMALAGILSTQLLQARFVTRFEAPPPVSAAEAPLIRAAPHRGPEDAP
jgi:asparagine synthase (glutamine-hydrolysing)